MTVPVYDGRNNFSLARYWANKYEGNVKRGTTVTIIFSVKQGKLSADAAPIAIAGMIGIYLNVLGVVVLEEPSDAFIPMVRLILTRFMESTVFPDCPKWKWSQLRAAMMRWMERSSEHHIKSRQGSIRNWIHKSD